jgi:alpha-tubulin suppressor-like RCC1 family protein
MKVTYVSCGSTFTLALIQGKAEKNHLSALYAWGNNEHGQLGLDNETMIEELP